MMHKNKTTLLKQLPDQPFNEFTHNFKPIRGNRNTEKLEE